MASKGYNELNINGFNIDLFNSVYQAVSDMELSEVLAIIEDDCECYAACNLE